MSGVPAEIAAEAAHFPPKTTEGPNATPTLPEPAEPNTAKCGCSPR
jgi:hypothetical protein